MKKGFKFSLIVAISMIILLFVSCKNSVDSEQDDTQQGYGTVSIAFGGGSARTVLPSEIAIDKLYYVLNFTQTNSNENITETQTGSSQRTIQLAVGTWDLVIRGYNSSSDSTDNSKALVSYSQNGIIVSWGESVTINAKLLPNLNNLTQNGNGTLRYNITFPEDVAGVLKVYTYPENALTGEPLVLSKSENTGSMNLISGYYNINVSYEYQGKIKSWSDLAHINDNAITEVVVGANDFTDYLPSPGPVDISLSMDKFTMTDEGEGIFDDIPQIILRKGLDSSETVGANNLVVVNWKIADTIMGTGNSLVLNADFFPMGIYSLNLTFIKDGKPWIGSLTFEVTGNLPDEYFELMTEDEGGTYWFDSDDISHRIDADCSGTYKIIGSSTIQPPDKVYIPAYYNGLPVTKISMHSVGDNSWQGAFTGCTNITEVYIPDTITEISNSAFCGCTQLSNITIPESVLEIGSYAFERCISLTNITIPEGVISVCSDAFRGCSNLEILRISSTVRFFGDGCGGPLGNCPKLTSIIVDENNEFYTSEGGILFNKDKTKLIAYPSANGAVTIPSGITDFGMSAFRGSNITSVEIPVGVTNITFAVFAQCENLTNVILPEGLEVIEQAAFMYSGLTNITIPASTNYLGPRAFEGCNSLTSVTFNGTISAENMTIVGINSSYFYSLPGDLAQKYLEGGIGTYTTTNPGNYSTWTKQ